MHLLQGQLASLQLNGHHKSKQKCDLLCSVLHATEKWRHVYRSVKGLDIKMHLWKYCLCSLLVSSELIWGGKILLLDTSLCMFVHIILWHSFQYVHYGQVQSVCFHGSHWRTLVCGIPAHTHPSLHYIHLQDVPTANSCEFTGSSSFSLPTTSQVSIVPLQ